MLPAIGDSGFPVLKSDGFEIPKSWQFLLPDSKAHDFHEYEMRSGGQGGGKRCHPLRYQIPKRTTNPTITTTISNFFIPALLHQLCLWNYSIILPNSGFDPVRRNSN